MSVWLCTPSARPDGGTAAKWREKGYKIALWRDRGEDLANINLLLTGAYPGHAAATNALCQEVLKLDSKAEWLVNAGDDTDPDPLASPKEIAETCSAYFGGREAYKTLDIFASDTRKTSTFGVMQPTGDPWAGHSIEKICGSPWIGREFCERAYGGNGPLWPEYFHMFDDEELQCVAQKLGVLWQRRDLTHLHHHWQRQDERVVRNVKAPEFLARANSRENWDLMGALFRRRQAAGFPGHEPLSAKDCQNAEGSVLSAR